MNKILVSYFSCSGVTKNIAMKISLAINGDIFEIKPVNIYTKEDLDWTNNNSRSSIEMSDKTSRPKIQEKVNNIAEYNKIVIGFPIWWYTAPTIINTFIEENDLTNKKVYIFVTSGGSNELKSFKDLKEKYSNINFISAKRFEGRELLEEYKDWIGE